ASNVFRDMSLSAESFRPTRHQISMTCDKKEVAPSSLLTRLKILPHEVAASSDRLGWTGLQAARCRAAPGFERDVPALTHHRLFRFIRPPDELDLRYEGVRRNVPPPAGSISLIPAGSQARVRSSGVNDELHIFLEPQLVARVGAEAFELDPARL